jgi:hypothetical protein
MTSPSTRVRVVACLFTLWGVGALVAVGRPISLITGALYLLVAVGLFRLQPLARKAALICLALALSGMVVFFLALTFAVAWRNNIRVAPVLGLSESAGLTLSITLAVATFVLSAWGFSSLRKHTVRALFYPSPVAA